MTVIFKGLDIEALMDRLLSYPMFDKCLKLIKSNRILVRLSSICLVGLIALSICVVSTGITLGFEVKYSGKTIATVASASVYDSAKKIAVENVSSNNVEGAIETPEFNLVLTVSDKLESASSVADSIIENTCDIISAAALVVNGKTFGYTDREELEALLNERLSAYDIEGAENTASFVEEVKIEEGYCLKCDIEDIAAVKEAVNELQVKTVSTVTSDEEIAYSTRKINTDTQIMGYYKITTAGQNGIKRVTQVIESINGEESGVNVVSEKVVAEPVTEIITIGTAPVSLDSTQKSSEFSSGFICPLTRGNFVVSSYYGDGRGHKAMDFSADCGEPIFASAAGSVTFSGYDGAYGYCVVIDHGNGFKTRYAHASSLCVKVGQVVAQGDMIAGVGSTGQSTGNHLHFEIIVNGTRVNPAPYIGF